MLEKFYRATLPHSYWNYANFLFEQGQYKKWVEMHIYSEISIDLISSESIKEVVSKRTGTNPAPLLSCGPGKSFFEKTGLLISKLSVI
ncbi:hypothetical protein RCO48_12940 [Peribacillus frigoritolerans]|nr:hypothetical protein [Peribacillus frigoritolerans]